MLITTATFQDAIEAHIIRGRMEVEGINAVVSFQHQLLLLRLAIMVSLTLFSLFISWHSPRLCELCVKYDF